MKKTKSMERLLWMCKVALMAALMIGLHMMGIAMIKTPWGAEITLDCAIVVIGMMAIDLKAGVVLALVFGGMSAYVGFTAPDALVVGPLLSRSPLLIIVLAVLPRLCIPFVAYGVQKLLEKKKMKNYLSTAVTGIAGSVTNTVLFLGTVFLMHVMIQSDMGPILAALGLSGLINGAAEAVFTAIVAPPVVAALKKLH